MPNNPTVRLGAVIVTHQSDWSIDRCVDALLQGARPPERVVIVDSGSDHAPDLDRFGPRVELVVLPDNVGFAAANNIGLRHLGATELVLFLNPDAFVDARFTEAAIRAMDAHPEVGALGPKLLAIDPDGWRPTGRIDSAGIVRRRSSRLVDRGQGEIDRGQYDDVESTDALCAAALVARCRALEAVAIDQPVFDESFFMHKEDIDLCWRLRRAGWALRYDPSLVVHHARGTKARRFGAAHGDIGYRSLRNEWKLLRKGGPPDGGRVRFATYLVGKSTLLAFRRLWARQREGEATG